VRLASERPGARIHYSIGVSFNFEVIKTPMKAIQIKQTGGPEVLELVDLPIPQPKSHEAVIKIHAAGVNFIDVYNREATSAKPPPPFCRA
jgi:hypothetical protein